VAKLKHFWLIVVNVIWFLVHKFDYFASNLLLLVNVAVFEIVIDGELLSQNQLTSFDLATSIVVWYDEHIIKRPASLNLGLLREQKLFSSDKLQPWSFPSILNEEFLKLNGEVGQRFFHLAFPLIYNLILRTNLILHDLSICILLRIESF